jgi:hypothetical protein
MLIQDQATLTGRNRDALERKTREEGREPLDAREGEDEALGLRHYKRQRKRQI